MLVLVKLVRNLNHQIEGNGNKSMLVRFLASPINPSDLNQIEGVYPIKPASFPAVGGNEGVARVESVGCEIKRFKVGDLVIPGRFVGKKRDALICMCLHVYVCVGGCWRDYACINEEDSFIKIPDEFKNLPIQVLATLKVNPPTAYRLLRDFVSLQANDFVIQNGANSAVGRLIIQMASRLGVNTVNVIRDRPDFGELCDELRGLACGAGSAIIVKAEDLKGFDFESCGEIKLGFNCVGGGAVADLSRLMAQGGTIVTYGAMSRRPLTIPASGLIFKNLSLRGFWLTHWYKQNPPSDEMFRDILTDYAAGHLVGPKHFWFRPEADNLDELKRGIESNLGKCLLKFD
jgi:mitochondrial enoyl-[acyl-carrier protein] reductase / trans-2-enoyl-CoA reductase